MAAKIIEKSISTLIVVCAIIVLAVLLSSAQDAVYNFTDFPEYYTAAKLIVAGKGAAAYVLSEMARTQHDLFPALGKRFIPIYLPPPGLILFTPIALFGLPMAFYVWKVASIACLVASVFLLVCTFSLDYKKTCYLVAGLALCHAFFEILHIDQIGTMLLLSLSAGLYFLQKDEDIKAGLALSFMIVKPQLILPFLVYLVGLRRWRPVIVFISLALGLTALAYLLIGEIGFSNYLTLLRAPESAFYMQAELMPTFRGQLLRLWPSLSKEIFYISAAVFFAVAFCSWFCGADNRKNAKAILWAFLLTIPLTLITSLHCHSYDLILLGPTMVIIFTDGVVSFSQRFKLIIIVGSIVFMIPLAIYIHYFYLLQGGPINIWFIELLVMEMAIIMRIMFNKEIE